MAILLFKLRHVPEDEANDVRQLLEQHDIDFYETTAGSWGVSLPALWLHDDRQLQQARALLDAYQEQRQKHAQAVYQDQCHNGQQRTLWNLLCEAPLRFVAALAAIAFILYLCSIPVGFLFS